MNKTSKKITIEKYNEKMDKIIVEAKSKKLSIQDTLMELIDKASKYNIHKQKNELR